MWQRGLVRKGLGLCHGICGNGYAFLSAYRATHDESYLQQALAFAHFATKVRASLCPSGLFIEDLAPSWCCLLRIMLHLGVVY